MEELSNQNQPNPIKKERKHRSDRKDWSTVKEITCHDCGELKPKSEYYKNKYSYCKSCWKKRNAGYNKNEARDTKRAEKVVKVEPKPKINSEHLDLDFNIFDTFSTIPTAEELEMDKLEKEIELYKKELLTSDIIEEEEVENDKKTRTLFTFIDSDDVLYHLSTTTGANFTEQIRELQPLFPITVYKNGEKCGSGDNIQDLVFDSSAKRYSIMKNKNKPFTVFYLNGESEEYTAKTFTTRYDTKPIFDIEFKEEQILNWKYRIQMIMKGV